ncbi:MAG TPA: hypothetical protein VE989_10880 [Sphingomicrobium sp.]|nr:hypothetical protein [Sphingomicrobium sp.]
MKLLLRIALATIIFWAIWIGIAGLAATVHGDCGIGATELEAAACVQAKRWVALVALAVGAVVYAILVRAIVKRSR